MKKIVPVLIALFAVSCAGSGDEAVKKSIANINEELVSIQRSLTDSQMSIEDMQAASSSAVSDIAANADAIAALKAEVAYLTNELTVLKGGRAGFDNNSVSEIQTVTVDNAIPVDEGQQIIIIEDSSASKNSIYSYAIELNRQRKYQEAREKFQEFLNKYPADELAGNAQYWIGETYYSVNEMTPAMDAFQAVLKKYPRSNKVPDAMLKIAYVYDRQGDRNAAVSTLRELLKKYPKTRPASLASQRLKSWGMN